MNLRELLGYHEEQKRRQEQIIAALRAGYMTVNGEDSDITIRRYEDYVALHEKTLLFIRDRLAESY